MLMQDLYDVMFGDRNVKVGAMANKDTDVSETAIPVNGEVNGSDTEHKLELFGFDSLVNILGLRRYLFY